MHTFVNIFWVSSSEAHYFVSLHAFEISWGDKFVQMAMMLEGVS